jgi:hypothetical protein
VEAPLRRSLGRLPQTSLQPLHVVDRHTTVGGVGSPAAGVTCSAFRDHALVLAASAVVTTPGALPSAGILRHRPRRYYGPLGLPLHRGRTGTRPPRFASPRRGLCRRISRVPCSSLNACCSPYPEGTRRPLRIWIASRGLRRDMSGSAPLLFLCRGCRLHVMLRPAFLLPGQAGLSTPRFGTADLSTFRRPATRRSDAYRDGTCTRWRSAARRLADHSVGVVTAHHARSVAAIL